MKNERAYSSPIAIGRLEHLTHNQVLDKFRYSFSKTSYHRIIMPLVYILYSKDVDHYYIGYTSDSIEVRIEKHLNNFYKNKYTGQTKDWELYLQIKCGNDKQARLIEKHIKKMKSRKYIIDLKKYPEMVINLLNKYS